MVILHMGLIANNMQEHKKLPRRTNLQIFFVRNISFSLKNRRYFNNTNLFLILTKKIHYMSTCTISCLLTLNITVRSGLKTRRKCNKYSFMSTSGVCCKFLINNDNSMLSGKPFRSTKMARCLIYPLQDFYYIFKP